jgi:hypothetical protein
MRVLVVLAALAAAAAAAGSGCTVGGFDLSAVPVAKFNRFVEYAGTTASSNYTWTVSLCGAVATPLCGAVQLAQVSAVPTVPACAHRFVFATALRYDNVTGAAVLDVMTMPDARGPSSQAQISVFCGEHAELVPLGRFVRRKAAGDSYRTTMEFRTRAMCHRTHHAA